jgi:RNA polymerase subunit RPABC4/transcription elongation factor Spt4
VSAEDERRPEGSEKSWGNLSDKHWSRARRDANQEALEYYRERSRAPGVAEGGAARNVYCMECDGVVPHVAESCPHCGAAIDPKVRRYFNWVEIDKPAESDLRSLLPIAAAGLALLAVLALALWFALS